MAQAFQRVNLLATALKLTTIYRDQHSRVMQAAENLLAAVREKPGPGPCLFHLRDDVFHGGEAPVQAETVPLRWLAERLREARVRGIAIEREATVDEVLALASWFREVRRRGPAAPPAPLEGRCRVVQMVFRGHHADAAGGGEGGAAAAAGQAGLLGSPVAAVRSSAGCRERLARIEGIAAAIAPEQKDEVDLVGVIGNLLPVDVASSPEMVNDVVLRVLDSLECDLRAVQASGRRFAGGQLLHRAIEVARRYFPCAPTSQPVTARQPAGRPEDAAIKADLLQFLEEYDELPLDDRPLADMIAGCVGTRLDHEFVAILVHGVARGHDNPAALTRLQQALRTHALDLPDLLDSYLRPERLVASARRLRLVQMLVDAGHAALVRDRGYLDHELVVKGFPESLQLVTNVLGSDQAATRLIAESLAMLGPSLAGSAGSLPVRSGALAQPAVWRTLLAVGGEVAHGLMLAVAAAHPVEVRAELVPWLRQQALPGPEAAVLQLLPNPQSLPAAWVRSLFVAVVRRRTDDALREATGVMLRQAVTEQPERSAADRLVAIDQLGEVPGEETGQLLTRLARLGRFVQWGPQARAIRRHAAAALARWRGNKR